jgi:hypothetical protein
MDAKKSTVATTKVQKKKEKEQEANAVDIALATEHVISNNKSLISDCELMEICCSKQLDTDLMRQPQLIRQQQVCQHLPNPSLIT